MPAPECDSRARFATTDWASLGDALHREGSLAAQALETLGQTYRFPIYAWFRQQGLSVHDAEDYTQDALMQILQPRVLRRVQAERGRFRDYLCGALRHFLWSGIERNRAKKRGGGKKCLPLALVEDESRFLEEDRPIESPDEAFDRRVAETVLMRAMQSLEQEERNAGNAFAFQALRSGLGAELPDRAYDEVVRTTGLSRNTLAKRLSRLRHRLSELALAEVVRMVGHPSQAREELRFLMRRLAQSSERSSTYLAMFEPPRQEEHQDPQPPDEASRP